MVNTTKTQRPASVLPMPHCRGSALEWAESGSTSRPEPNRVPISAIDTLCFRHLLTLPRSQSKPPRTCVIEVFYTIVYTRDNGGIPSKEHDDTVHRMLSDVLQDLAK
jgi:hypothetical protein